MQIVFIYIYGVLLYDSIYILFVIKYTSTRQVHVNYTGVETRTHTRDADTDFIIYYIIFIYSVIQLTSDNSYCAL